MNHLTRYIRRHHIALVALFVALGGTSYAAVNLPKNSVGSAQIKNGSITTKKVKNGSITAKKLANNSVTSVKVKNGSLRAVDFAPGQLPKGERGPAGLSDGPAGGALTGSYPNPGIANGAVGPDQLAAVPAVRLVRGSTPAFDIPTGGQGTPIEWPAALNARAYDNANFFQTESTTACPEPTYGGPLTCITFPRDGVYAVSAGLRWNETGEGAGLGYRTIRLHSGAGRQFGTQTVSAAPAGSQTFQNVSTTERFEAGDFAYVSGLQTSGHDLPVVGSLQQVHFAAVWLAP